MNKSFLKRIEPPLSDIKAEINIPVEFFTLENGSPVYLINAGTEDVIRMEVVFRAGAIHETVQLVATTTNMMLTEGSENYSSEELNRILDYYGIFLNLTAEKDIAGLTVFFLNKYTEKAFELISEVLFHPVFPEKELDMLLKKRLSWYMINREKVQNLATDQFFESVFGSDHPYGRRTKETDFSAITPQMLRIFHSGFYRSDSMKVIISGKIDGKIPEILNKYFGKLSSISGTSEKPHPEIHGEPDRKKHIKKEGALQTAFRIGSATINKRHPDYPGLKVLNTILGGYFGSRLMKNIREEKGFTYGIHSSVSSFDRSGFKVISTETGKKYVRQAAEEIYREILRLNREPVKEEELMVVRNYMLGELLRMFDGPFAMAESLRSVIEFGIDAEYYKSLVQTVRTITPDEILRLASTYYKPDDLYEITAG